MGGIPHMFLVDRDGRLACAHEGYGDGLIPQLADEINRLLDSPPAPAPTPKTAPTAAPDEASGI